MKRIALFLSFFISILAAKVYAGNMESYRNFWVPQYLGERLAWCTLDGKECGMPVAAKYCQLMGYAGAVKVMKANNVGLTNYINTHARCKGWTCDSFMTIVCSKSLQKTHPQAYHYREQAFVYPRYAGFRVDWCLKKGVQCGRQAAWSFCRRIGFLDVKQYKMQKHIGATKTIGSEELCFGQECRGFSKIICHR